MLLFLLGGLRRFSQGTWVQKANFGGSKRLGVVGFSIGKVIKDILELEKPQLFHFITMTFGNIILH
ncbi:MAG: hypothetical protein EPN85_06115 [Bacteroidetes bacterium]|nr:MAG: hypothetical protein EPN85_06115 [Bacteroidota bacterium]